MVVACGGAAIAEIPTQQIDTPPRGVLSGFRCIHLRTAGREHGEHGLANLDVSRAPLRTPDIWIHNSAASVLIMFGPEQSLAVFGNGGK
jgi:hypothetical protein